MAGRVKRMPPGSHQGLLETAEWKYFPPKLKTAKMGQFGGTCSISDILNFRCL
jgi:hypothetical protein